MNYNCEQILRILQEHQETIRGYGVQRLGLFGSCVSGKADAGSDLDFVVEFQNKTFDAYMDLKFFLEDLFDCHIDLVLANVIKPRLRSRILKEAVHAPGL